MKFKIFRYVVRGRCPFAVAIAEVDGKTTLAVGIERGWDVNVGSRDEIVDGVPTKGVVEERLSIKYDRMVILTR